MKKIVLLFGLITFQTYASDLTFTFDDRGWSQFHEAGTNLIYMRKDILLSYEGNLSSKEEVLKELEAKCDSISIDEVEKQNQADVGEIVLIENYIRRVDTNSPVIDQKKEIVWGAHLCRIDLKVQISR